MEVHVMTCIVSLISRENVLSATTRLPVHVYTSQVPFTLEMFFTERSLQHLIFQQGHPTTIFCKITVWRSKYCLKFSIAWGYKFLDDCSIHTCFSRHVINSLRFSEAQFFTFHSPGNAVFHGKRKPKIFGLKNVIERGSRKILTFIKG